MEGRGEGEGGNIGEEVFVFFCVVIGWECGYYLVLWVSVLGLLNFKGDNEELLSVYGSGRGDMVKINFVMG